MQNANCRVVEQPFSQTAPVRDPVTTTVRPVHQFRYRSIGGDPQAEPVAIIIADDRQCIGQHETTPNRSRFRGQQLFGGPGPAEFGTA